VNFLKRLRDIETFADVNALCKQLALDVEKVQNVIGLDK
jgi:FAD synthase